jgi:hypothetical protein
MLHAEFPNCLRFSFAGDKLEKSRKPSAPACACLSPGQNAKPWQFYCVANKHSPYTQLADSASLRRPQLICFKSDGPARGGLSRGCLAALLNRLEKFQQVGVDLICVRGGEAMRHAGVENLLSSLDEFGRSLS